MPMLYYGLVVVGTAALVLAIYNLIIIRRCTRRQMQPQPAGPGGRLQVEVDSRRCFHENPNRNLLSSFKYKKEEQRESSVQGHEELLEGTVEYECPVCLSVFEEGEEVRKLPRCKHCFHVICIDMWLYSHFDCPVCRTPVGPSCQRIPVNNNNAAAENSREGLLESGMFV